METTEISQIAQSVAKALGLDLLGLWHGEGDKFSKTWWSGNGYCLMSDGSNLFDDRLFRECLEWLRKNGVAVCFEPETGGTHWYRLMGNRDRTYINCAAAEFPALAIHSLMQAKSCSGKNT